MNTKTNGKIILGSLALIATLGSSLYLMSRDVPFLNSAAQGIASLLPTDVAQLIQVDDSTSVRLSQQEVSVDEIAVLNPEDIQITFPSEGEEYPIIPAVVGEITADSSGVERVYVKLFNETTGQYYDGSAFVDEDTEVLAYGTDSWILNLEVDLDPDQQYSISARTLMKDGSTVVSADTIGFEGRSPYTAQELADRVVIEIPSGNYEVVDTSTETFTFVPDSDSPDGLGYWQSSLSGIIDAYTGETGDDDEGLNLAAGSEPFAPSCAVSEKGTLLAWWNGDVDSDGRAVDAIGGRRGSMGNASSEAGPVGNAYVFARNTSINLGSGLITGTQPFSISLWVNTTSPKWQVLFTNRSPYNWNGTYRAVMNANGQVGFYTGASYPQNILLSERSGLNDGRWHHVLAVMDGSKSYVYIDGELEGENNRGGQYHTASTMYLGANVRDRNAYFNGALDEVMVYSEALTSEDVDSLYRSQLSQNCPSPELPGQDDTEAEATQPTEIVDESVIEREVDGTVSFGSETNEFVLHEATNFQCDEDVEPGYISSELTQLVKSICGDTRVVSEILQEEPEDAYTVKYEELLERDLIKNLPPLELNTIGIRDSDEDGLSDKIEILAGTDPFYWDTDRDSYSDGEEVLTYGTDPLDAQDIPGERITITNIPDGMRTGDPRPILLGGSRPNANVEIYTVRNGQRDQLVARARAEEHGAYMAEPAEDLKDGVYTVKAYDVGPDGEILDESKSVTFIVDSTVLIAPPEIDRVIVRNMKPQIYGSTQFGSTVFGQFELGIAAASVIADTQEGDFMVSSARPLDAGPHVAYLYATLPNGVRSASVTVPFTVEEEGILNLGSLIWLVWILLGIGLATWLGWFLWTHRRTDMALFSVDTKELKELEGTKHLKRYTWKQRYPVTKYDLRAKMIGFYVNYWEQEMPKFKEFKHVQPGLISVIGRLEELNLYPKGKKKPVDVLLGGDLPSDLEGAHLEYVFSLYDHAPENHKDFAEKKNVSAKRILNEEIQYDDEQKDISEVENVELDKMIRAKKK